MRDQYIPGVIGPVGLNMVDRNVYFHPAEVTSARAQNYYIRGEPQMTQMYEIGNGQYMIGDPRYMIGATGYMIGQPNGLAMAPAGAPAWAGGLGVGQAPQAPVAVQMMPAPTIVRKQDPTESKLQPVGCNVETNIDVGAVGVATVRPQKIFKPERFTVPPTVAPDFLIDSISVGVYNQSPAISSIPAEAFLTDSIYSNVDFDTCQISQELSVRARNRGGAPRPFFSTFFGRVLQ